MRKCTLRSQELADTSHKSSCLSYCISKAECACGYEDWQLRPSVISQRESEPAVEITLTVRGATGDDCTVLISGHYRFESAAKEGKVL